MNKIILLLSLIFISSCANHRILIVEKRDEILHQKQNFCYHLDLSLGNSQKIFKTNFLNNDRQSSDFYIQYIPKNLVLNVINISKMCVESKIYIMDINIFKKHLSDTAQWRDIFYVAVDIGYQGKNYKLDNVRFKDYETTGWIYDFKIRKSKSVIFTKTIERALVRIFTDIEDAITNKLTLEQRNAKKDAKRLETEKLMDKYIKAQKELTNE